MKCYLGFCIFFVLLGVMTAQQRVLRRRPIIIRRIPVSQLRRFQITRAPAIQTIGGLATIGLGGVFQAGGLLGGTVGIQAPQVRQVTFSQAGNGLSGLVGTSRQPVFFRSGDSSSDRRGPQRADTPDPQDPRDPQDLTPDTPDYFYAPRGMVTNAQQAAALQKMTESDGVIVM